MKTIRSVAAALVLLSLTAFYQNCSSKTFGQDVQVVDVACENAEGCQSAASTAPEVQQSQVQQPAPTPVPSAPQPQVSNPAPQPAPAPQPQVTMYNFVAGDKPTCDQSLQNHGFGGSCTLGGGCGISCGMPSPSCPSANPHLYGACVTR